MVNPLIPPFGPGLSELARALAQTQTTEPSPLSAIAHALVRTRPGTPATALASIFADDTPRSSLGGGLAAYAQSLPGGLGSLTPSLHETPLVAEKRRVTFFSFHFADLMRVNNVRQAFAISKPATSTAVTFIDGSIWGTAKLSGDDAIRRLIRDGMKGSSVVCVLTGSETWSRPWVRYEIARSVIERKGLLAIHINGLRHHQTRTIHPRGPNPLAYMGVGRDQHGRHYLFESDGQKWTRYGGYQGEVDLPAYLSPPAAGFVRSLSTGASEWDYVLQDGRDPISGWLDLAAKEVGR